PGPSAQNPQRSRSWADDEAVVGGKMVLTRHGGVRPGSAVGPLPPARTRGGEPGSAFTRHLGGRYRVAVLPAVAYRLLGRVRLHRPLPQVVGVGPAAAGDAADSARHLRV